VAISDAVAAEVAVKYVAKEIAENVADLETAIADEDGAAFHGW
jgi:hypothetical protein